MSKKSNEVSRLRPEEFQEFLVLDGSPEDLEDHLRRIPRIFHDEAQYRTGLTARLVVEKKNRKDALKLCKQQLYMDYRALKDAGDKTLTEAVITAKIESDEEILKLSEEDLTLETAVKLRQDNIDALYILMESLKILGRSLHTERCIPQ